MSSSIDLTDSLGTYHDFHALTRLRGQANEKPQGALKQTAQQFEAYFLQEMMKSMRKTVEKSDLVEQGTVEFYEEMMDKEFAMMMAKRGGIGLAKTLEAQIQRLKESPATGNELTGKGFPLNRVETPMSIKPGAAQAYELMRKELP
jgi:peptidoglycan hydrolase FlgJ